jgi:hypothetical protein
MCIMSLLKYTIYSQKQSTLDNMQLLNFQSDKFVYNCGQINYDQIHLNISWTHLALSSITDMSI